jgi:dienelactone hydrolase
MMWRALLSPVQRILLASCLAAVAPAIIAQTLKISPNRLLIDESAVVRAEGLAPGERVAIQAELVDGANEPWASHAEFAADEQGAVDTSKQAPVKGSYTGVSATGLVWSMKPTAKHVASYQGQRDLGPQTITFNLIRNGQKVANAQLEQLAIVDGVKRINLNGQLHGAFLLPNTPGKHPGVLVVGGSEGGLPLRRAAWLASRGYAALALAYFRYEDLPRMLEGIPLEYFRNALGWMMQRPEIASDHIGVLGVSRGGELALQLGSMFPDIKAVVAYVPANVRFPACCGNTAVPYAWTWHGQPLAFVPRRELRNPQFAMEAAIAVEHTHGPILLIAGEDDGVWESSRMTEAVAQRLNHAHFPYSCERLIYRHAGHRAGKPEIVPTWHGTVTNPTSGHEENLGGNAEGDAESSLDAIPKVLEFLRRNLGETTEPPAPGTAPSGKCVGQ